MNPGHGQLTLAATAVPANEAQGGGRRFLLSFLHLGGTWEDVVPWPEGQGKRGEQRQG